MPLTKIQQNVISIFNSNEFLQKKRDGLSLKEKRLLLHKQFLTFMELVDFKISYANKDYQEALDLYEILHLLDIELVVKMGVQFNLWGETIYRLGTKKHAPYLGQTERLEILGCFGMTEIGHGSNISKLETVAKYNPSSESFTIHSPTYTSHKFWIGQAAMFAHYCIVFAQLYIGGVCHGVHPFIVPIRDIISNEVLEGITIKDCGHKNGLNSIDNGEIAFDHIDIPYDNLLDKYVKIHNATGKYISEKGRLSKMLNELSKNRFGLGEGCNLISRYYLHKTLKYTTVRKQFGGKKGEVPIISYPIQHKRLFPLLSKAIILDIYLKNSRKYIEDNSKSHISSIISKIYGTWNCLTTLQQCREVCGGHGYHKLTNIGNVYKHVDIYTTFEGDNSVLLQQLFQTYMKIYKDTLNIKGVVWYKVEGFYNRNIGYLDDIFPNNKLSLQTLIYNISYTIEYKIKHLLLLLRDAIEKKLDPFLIWRSHQTTIVSVAKMICLLNIVQVFKDLKHNYLINYLLELFIINHIREDIESYSSFMKLKDIVGLDKYEQHLFTEIYKNLSFYLYKLDIPYIYILENANHLDKIMSNL